MFPLLALTALAAGFAGYQYSKSKNQNQNQYIASKDTSSDDKNSAAKNVNTYNYYTNESENGNTLFGSQKKTKRTLFGGEAV